MSTGATTPGPALPEALLQQASERLERRMGLHFPPPRYADLERGLVQAARGGRWRDPVSYTESILRDDVPAAELQALAGFLTIGETHFFRDPIAFQFLETRLLPELIARKRERGRQLRVWSAGCATGEEPYSLAILLHRLISDLGEWGLTILGTDLNPQFLARAVAGTYSDWSFRDTPSWGRERYFIGSDKRRYEIQPWVKRLVVFASLNLVDDAYPSALNNTNAMDLIVCRNVLLYFTPTRTVEVLERFQRALLTDGQLLLGAVEASQVRVPGLAPVPASGLALYRKAGATDGDVSGHWASAIRRGGTVWEPAGGVLSLTGVSGGSRAGTPLRPAAELAMEPPTSGRDHQPLQTGPQAGTVDPRPARSLQTSRVPHDRSAVASDGPQHRGSACGVARDLYAAGRYHEARQELVAGIARAGASDPQAGMLLAQCHANLGDLAEALVWCDRALALARTDLALQSLRANILQELGRPAEALQSLRKVLFLDPGHVLAHYATASLHRHQGQMALAARHYANVRQLLNGRGEDEELPQSGGLTAGRLRALVTAAADCGMRNAECGLRNAECGVRQGGATVNDERTGGTDGMDQGEMKARTKRFAVAVVRLAAALPRTRIAVVLGDQLLRAGTSVGANLVRRYDLGLPCTCCPRSRSASRSRDWLGGDGHDHWLSVSGGSGAESQGSRVHGSPNPTSRKCRTFP